MMYNGPAHEALEYFSEIGEQLLPRVDAFQRLWCGVGD